jgi:hypothetical protein
MGSRAKPHIAAALICEKVLQESDGVISAIRLVDTLYFGFVLAPGAVVPDPPPPIQVSFTALVIVKAGDALGSQKIRIAIVNPRGAPVGEPAVFEPYFEQPESGANFVVNVGLQTNELGRYWLEVYSGSDAKPLARTPFRIVPQPPKQLPAEGGELEIE